LLRDSEVLFSLDTQPQTTKNTTMHIQEGYKLTGNGLNLTCTKAICITPPLSMAGDEWEYTFQGLDGQVVVWQDYELTDILADGATITK